jgi:ABC-type branched-subunit amino acid transport system substrate-binding protein
MLALRHVNERNGSIVPVLATLTPSFRLRGLIFDTESVSQGGIQAYSDGRAQGADAIVGATRSAVSERIALLAGIESVPQISYASSSPVFTDKNSYPYFTRTYPNDDLSAATLVGLLHSFGWRNVAVLHVNDNYGSGYTKAMANAAAAHPEGDDLRVRAVSVDFGAESGAAADAMRTAVHQIKRSGENIIVTVLFSVENFLLEVALENMLTADYAYIHIEGETHVQVPEEQQRQLSGMLSWQVDPRATPGYQRFRDAWTTVKPADCSTSDFTPPSAEVFAQPPSDFSAFIYDAVSAMALALHDSGLQGGSTSINQRRLVLDNLLNSSFEGTTGIVQFSSNGDRAPAGLTYSLDNFVYTGDMLALHTARLSHGGVVLDVDDIVWLEGSSQQPTDLMTVGDDSRSDGFWDTPAPAATLFTLCLIIPVLVLTCIVCRWHRQRRNQVFRLKATGAPPKLVFTSEVQQWHLL